MDAEGDLVCPECESVDVILLDVADGYELKEVDEDED